MNHCIPFLAVSYQMHLTQVWTNYSQVFFGCLLGDSVSSCAQGQSICTSRTSREQSVLSVSRRPYYSVAHSSLKWDMIQWLRERWELVKEIDLRFWATHTCTLQCLSYELLCLFRVLAPLSDALILICEIRCLVVFNVRTLSDTTRVLWSLYTAK